jgi:hypothetical protein
MAMAITSVGKGEVGRAAKRFGWRLYHDGHGGGKFAALPASPNPSLALRPRLCYK